MPDSRAVGRAGEDDAVNYLVARGYSVLHRNFRYGRYGEIDIIASLAGVVCFIEVKSRSGDRYGTPAEAVGHAKQKKILAVANHFLRISGMQNRKIRFDIMEIYFLAGELAGGEHIVKHIRHIENAFGA